MGFFLLSFCEPFAIFPYFMRAVRLAVIFKAQNEYQITKTKPTKWFKLIKEAFLMKLTLLYALVLLLISIILFCIPSVREIWPSYNITNCFVSNLADSLTGNNNFNIHVNTTLIMLIIMSFVECLLLVLAIYFIRNI